MGRLPTSSGPAAAPRLRLGHADAAERRVDVERIGGDAVADAPRLAVEQVGGDDLEVVVRGVREGAAPVAVAERPDARHVGLQLRRPPRCSRVRRSPRRRARARGRRCWAAGRPRAARASRRPRVRPSLQSTLHGDVARRCCANADAGGVGAHLRCPRASRIAATASRHVLVLARDQARPFLDDRDLAAEAAVHLRELEPDVAAADDDEMPRHASRAP